MREQKDLKLRNFFRTISENQITTSDDPEKI